MIFTYFYDQQLFCDMLQISIFLSFVRRKHFFLIFVFFFTNYLLLCVVITCFLRSLCLLTLFYLTLLKFIFQYLFTVFYHIFYYTNILLIILKLLIHPSCWSKKFSILQNINIKISVFLGTSNILILIVPLIFSICNLT